MNQPLISIDCLTRYHQSRKDKLREDTLIMEDALAYRRLPVPNYAEEARQRETADFNRDYELTRYAQVTLENCMKRRESLRLEKEPPGRASRRALRY